MLPNLPYLGIRRKLLIAFVALVVVPLVSFGAVAIFQARSFALDRMGRQLSGSVAANAHHVSATCEVIVGDVLLLGATADAELALGDDSGRARLSARFLELARLRRTYAQIRLIEGSGREVIRVNRRRDGSLEIVPTAEMQNKAQRYYFQEARRVPHGQVYVSRIDFNVEHEAVEPNEELMLRFATSVRGGEVIVINVYARDILDRVRPLVLERGALVVLDGTEHAVRQSCSGQACSLTLGTLHEQLGEFPASTRESARSGVAGTMLEGQSGYLSYSRILLPEAATTPHWVLGVITPRSAVLEPVETVTLGLASLVAFFVALSVACAGLAARALARPILELRDFVLRAAAGDRSAALSVSTGDEIEQLAAGVAALVRSVSESEQRLVDANLGLEQQVAAKVRELRALLEERHQLELQLQEADRLSTLGMLATVVAHEIGNPLAGIRASAQVELRDGTPHPETRKVLEAIVSEVDRLTKILSQLRSLARRPRPELAEVSVASAFVRIHGILERALATRTLSVRFDDTGAGDLKLRLPEGRLEQVLLNLVLNATQAVGETGRVEVSAAQAVGGVTLRVDDDGPGVPVEHRERVFEPLFTTKHGGTGVGLAVVRQIAEDAGGHVRVSESALGGARFEVTFPRSARD